MKILFIDLTGDYNTLSPMYSPLGGTETAICYLASTLSKRGHEVSIINKTSTPGVYDNVYCLNLKNSNCFNNDYFNSRDVIIFSNAAILAKNYRNSGMTTPLLFWSGHNSDQPAVSSFQDEEIRSSWTKIFLVSEWQKQKYIENFGFNPDQITVIQNAIGRSFEPKTRSKSFYFEEGRPPILIYTSAPYRGLFPLIRIFPVIRQMVPGTTLRVYSSMKMYDASKALDEFGNATKEDPFTILYDKCISTEGVEYYGSVNQEDLSKALSESDIFSYPNTFEETSCISLMQAMASGCLPVFNNLGALVETSAGFGKAFETSYPTDSDEFALAYGQFLINVIQDSYAQKDIYRSSINEQIRFVHEHYTWEPIAARWEAAILQILATAPERRMT